MSPLTQRDHLLPIRACPSRHTSVPIATTRSLRVALRLKHERSPFIARMSPRFTTLAAQAPQTRSTPQTPSPSHARALTLFDSPLPPLAGATINVATGNELFNAVASSSSGDRIIVADGTVDMDTRNRGALRIEKKDLTIQAKNPRGAILISGFDADESGGDDSMIHIGKDRGVMGPDWLSTTAVTLEGLIIRGGRTTKDGGAIYHNAHTLTVRDCLIEDHKALEVSRPHDAAIMYLNSCMHVSSMRVSAC